MQSRLDESACSRPHVTRDIKNTIHGDSRQLSLRHPLRVILRRAIKQNIIVCIELSRASLIYIRTSGHQRWFWILSGRELFQQLRANWSRNSAFGIIKIVICRGKVYLKVILIPLIWSIVFLTRTLVRRDKIIDHELMTWARQQLPGQSKDMILPDNSLQKWILMCTWNHSVNRQQLFCFCFCCAFS